MNREYVGSFIAKRGGLIRNCHHEPKPAPNLKVCADLSIGGNNSDLSFYTPQYHKQYPTALTLVMHLLILGGTGPCGILLIRDALAADHTVVVYARSPDKLPQDLAKHPSVTLVRGQLTDADALSKALDGVHAVLSALGPPTSQPFTYPSNTPLAHAYSILIETMKKRDVKRLIALGTASIVDDHDKFDLKFRTLITGVWLLAHNAYKDIVAIGEVIKKEGADLVWTIVRVPILTNSEAAQTVAGYVGDGKTGTTLSRAGFASFVLGELENNEWLDKAPLISAA